MNGKWITVSGAREHNLRNVDVRIPRNKLTVITGLSGSGKSSLAFDTLYAEGQRKYVESLSAYARQFLEQMQKPDVDTIEGLSPAISIEQRTAGSNPRSIVATVTEIHDYLRLLFPSIGKVHCPSCGKPIQQQSAENITEQLLALPEKTRVMLLAPLVRGRKGKHEEVFESIRRQGFVRMRVDGELLEIENAPDLEKNKKHTIEAVVDRLVINPSDRSRINDSVELALSTGEGLLIAMIQNGNDWDDRLYSEKNACLDCNISFESFTPKHFSFNSPYGACQTCHGLGNMLTFDEELVVPNEELPLEEAIHPWRRGGRRAIIYYKKLLASVADAYGVDLSTPFNELPASFKKVLFYGSDEPISYYMRRRKIVKPFEGVIPNLERRYTESDSEWTQERLRAYMGNRRCTACHGARLRPESLACTIGGQNIHELCRLSIEKAQAFFQGLKLSKEEAHIAKDILKEIQSRLGFMMDVGLDYLTLDRESGTLSGGEAQRIRLATQIGSRLTGVLYVLDEPSIGLHQRDNDRLLATLKELRDLGNTVVVVEHDEQTIREADYVIDLGPGAGVHGGEIVFAGTPAQLLRAKKSLTAQYLRREVEIEVPEKRTKAKSGFLEIRGAAENNLKNVNVKIPLGLLTCVTGVSGSGKSTLTDDVLRRALFRRFFGSKERPGKHKELRGVENIDKVIVIDQSPIGRTPRSNPATYTGAFSIIRDLFAQLPASKVRGYKPGRFSFNVKGGRCEHCQGDGLLKIEMHFLPDVYVTCPQCSGKRYNRETLEVHYNGKNISEVLEMTINESCEFFSAIPGIERKLRTLREVGLGYLRLGQPATTLSGGEAQRIKLSAELSKKATGKTLYILDEPTTGLHFADVHKLVEVLETLRDEGNTVLVIEHNLDVIKRADWLIDLGPEGGERGGKVVVAGTPEKVSKTVESYTGKYLAEMLSE
ncbi:excinuclease ABC subunit UvrA [Tichowtungia aerotolerans]|uniref:UvrABC system protein A n=1 Tax=Tichowtungia aerotolerans TaxID=2697043 RepID=A0A6P1M2U5_9BACT|nr:excinuclease ABC subunit UvrA [Tichowtungia aerotolerans]QHI68157.1 excinuclease ABC subunit UvrA [Tichowtungia aerotolerans]